ncbi:hypothetical protein [Hydrogenophaga sp.]|jgi:hypothetical protein|uniref:hypothetical protein n=1 Tax=Hydrogenophaga sp. TaxID=1904254 RepID=UPI003F6F1EA4
MKPLWHRIPCALMAACLATGMALAQQPPASVEISHRMTPDSDFVTDTVSEGMNTIHVVEDRGIVAKTAERGGRFPVHLNTVNRQSIRFTSTPRVADGSFGISMAFLAQSDAMRNDAGEETPLPRKASLAGGKVSAQAGPDGRVKTESLAFSGMTPEQLQIMQTTLTAILQQVNQVDSIHVVAGKSTEQVIELNVPVATITTMALKMTASYRLLEVKDNVAFLDITYVMDFGSPAQAFKVQANGSGAGTMEYDTALQRVVSSTTHSGMEFEFSVPDGTLRLQSLSKQTQTMRAPATGD